MQEISEIQPFLKEVKVFHLPACRVLGVEQLYKVHGGTYHQAAPQWTTVTDSPVWKTLRALPPVIPNSCVGWTCDYVPETDMFSYLTAVLAPANTPVPQGCQFRDVPETLVAVGLWGQPMDQVITALKSLGYVTNYDQPGCGWNAELYLDAEENAGEILGVTSDQEWRWLIPCKQAPQT